jgi:hypothetical protein
VTAGEPDAGKLACPVRREATRKRTHLKWAPRRVVDPTRTVREQFLVEVADTTAAGR